MLAAVMMTAPLVMCRPVRERAGQSSPSASTEPSGVSGVATVARVPMRCKSPVRCLWRRDRAATKNSPARINTAGPKKSSELRTGICELFAAHGHLALQGQGLLIVGVDLHRTVGVSRGHRAVAALQKNAAEQDVRVDEFGIPKDGGF